MKGCSVQVSATCANLGPGFDCLGLALNFYNDLNIETRARGLRWSIEGEGKGELPAGPDNLAYRAMQRVYEKVGKPMPGMVVRQVNRLPLNSGLGSSASAIVSGLVAANTLLGKPLTTPQLLDIAGDMEGHPDNVAPALLGGFTVAWRERERTHALQLPFPPRIQLVVATPNVRVDTEAARAVLPREFPLSDVVFSISRACMLMAGLLQRHNEWLWDATQDRIHTPYRSELIPGYEAVAVAAHISGAAAFFISGSGPTVAALVQTDQVTNVQQAMQEAFDSQGVEVHVRPARVSDAPPLVTTW